MSIGRDAEAERGLPASSGLLHEKQGMWSTGEHCNLGRDPPLGSDPLEQWGGNKGGCGAAWVVLSEMLSVGGGLLPPCALQG